MTTKSGSAGSHRRLTVATCGIIIAYVLLLAATMVNNATFLIFALGLGVVFGLLGVTLWLVAVVRESRDKGVL